LKLKKMKTFQNKKRRAIPLSDIALSGYLNKSVTPLLLVKSMSKFTSNIASVYYCLKKIRRIQRIIIPRSKIPFADVFD